MTAVRDEDARVHIDRWQRRAAPVEDEQLGLELRRQLHAFEHVRLERRAGESSPGTAAADRRNAGERGHLEVIGSRVATRAGEREQIVERRRRLDKLRLRGAASAHRDDDDPAVTGENARHVPGHGRLPDPLAQADHGKRRCRERLERRRLEAKVGADVRQAERERTRCPQHPLPRPQHRLVGEVDHEIRRHGVEGVDEGDAVVLASPDLLRPADEERPDDLVGKRRKRVPHDRRVVLSVDQDKSSHVDRTSSSIRAVYFS